MTAPKATTTADRLRVSPNFAVAFALDGRAYVAKETEPYEQYWLTDRDRILHGLFAGRRGATSQEAIDGYFRVTRATPSAPACARLRTAVENMRAAGVVVGGRDDASRYSARIVDAYVTHRPFPSELAAFLIHTAPISAQTHVLDLAGGPGDLSLALAGASEHVSLMELSRGFLTAAGRRAKSRGLELTLLHDSCNRLVYADQPYDVITVSQALHWLDDVLVCRGVCRVLRPDGSFFVIHGTMEVDDAHPLAFVFGHQSVLGPKVRQPFADEVAPLLRRLTLLFDALDAPDVPRHDRSQRLSTPGCAAPSRIVPTGVSLFRQRRPFGLGFARAFLTDQHIELAGFSPAAFWADVEAASAAATPEALMGTQHWAILHFRRGGPRLDPGTLQACPIADIGAQTSEA